MTFKIVAGAVVADGNWFVRTRGRIHRRCLIRLSDHFSVGNLPVIKNGNNHFVFGQDDVGGGGGGGGGGAWWWW